MKALFTLLAALALVAPLAVDAQTTPTPAALITVRVASSYNDSNAEAWYALEEGFFQQVGLNVVMTPFNNGDAAAAALAAGDIDIAVQPPMQLGQAVIGRLPFVMIAPGAVNTINAPDAWICVGATSSIKTPRDLVGKTIALNAVKSSSANLLFAWLAKNGIAQSSVHIIEIPSAQMAPALQRGTVDAAELFEPAYSVGLRAGTIRLLANPTDGLAVHGGYLQTVWYTTKQFATQNRDTVSRFTKAIYLAARWANTHPHDSGLILAKLSKLDLDVVNGMVRVRYAESFQPSDLLPELNGGVKSGLLSRPVSPSELLLQ